MFLDPDPPPPLRPHKGRGAVLNPKGRFEPHETLPADDGWGSLDALMSEPSPETEIRPDRSRSIIAENSSPDIGFDRSINPYRGCEHGCVYCYARPFHAFLGLSSGLDFETKIFAKHDAAALLRAALSAPSYRPQVLALGAVTDPYQPAEKRLAITRSVLEVLLDARHPVGIVTKSHLVTRDLDLLQELAAHDLVRVAVSITTLDPALARTLEPRCPAPRLRLAAVERLARAGVPVSVNLSPVIPALNDPEIEAICAAAASAGAHQVNYVILRLPHEVKELFTAWLEIHQPLKKDRVLALVRETHGGKLYEPAFGQRMRGSGPYARLIRDRFEQARRRLGLDRRPPMPVHLFRRPAPEGQLRLL
jgi:DNA repair photolyase